MTGAAPTRSAPTGATRVAAVIGDPVRHSRSPVILNAAFQAAGLDWVYVALEVASGSVPAALDGVRALGIGGLSVTMPHKEPVAAAVDVLDDDARALGAVNCVVNVDGVLHGHNTDGPGFVAGLAVDPGFAPDGRRCVVFGAGGAARAVVLALGRAGAAEVAVVNRDPTRAVVAAALAGPVGRVASPGEIGAVVSSADLVVNATPVGMGAAPGSEGPLPFDPGLLTPGQVVADLVYQPLVTPLVAAARARGVTAVNGVSMLVHQAAIAFEWWTGVTAPLEAMTAAVAAELAAP